MSKKNEPVLGKYLNRGQVWKEPKGTVHAERCGTSTKYPAKYWLILDADGTAISSESDQPDKMKMVQYLRGDEQCPWFPKTAWAELKQMKRPTKDVQAWADEMLAKFDAKKVL